MKRAKRLQNTDFFPLLTHEKSASWKISGFRARTFMYLTQSNKLLGRFFFFYHHAVVASKMKGHEGWKFYIEIYENRCVAEGSTEGRTARGTIDCWHLIQLMMDQLV